MKKLLLILAVFNFQINYSQDLLMEFEVVSSPDAFAPKFEGGDVTKFYDFINKHFDYTKVKKAGKMVFSFTINELGELKNIRIVDFLDTDAAMEMIRVLNLSPKWQSATRNGKPFSTDIKMPITFKEKIVNQVVDNKKEEEIKGDTSQLDIKKEFNGGLSKFHQFIAKNYITPENLKVSGKVIISFTVDVDGSLTDIKVLKDLGFGTGAEAIRVLKLSNSKWTPAVKNGKPVKSTFTLPITISAPRN